MSKGLNTVFLNCHEQLICLVRDTTYYTHADKDLLTESILNIALGFAVKSEKLPISQNLHDLRTKLYKDEPEIAIGNFAFISAKEGNYYFKFKDKQTAIGMTLVRTYIKSVNFIWNTGHLAFVKKISNVPFNQEYFIKEVLRLASQQGF